MSEKKDKKQEATAIDLTDGSIRFSILTKTLLDILALTNHVTNEVIRIVFSDSIEYRITDPCHVEMMITSIKKEMLTEYHIISHNESGTVVLGIDVQKLISFLKDCDKKTEMVFEYDSRVDHHVFNVSVGAMKRQFSTCDIEGMLTVKEPHLDLPAHFNVSLDQLKSFIKQAGKVIDHMSIETTDKKVTLYADGDSDKVNMSPSVENLWSHSTHKSLFSLDYLGNIISSLKTLFDSVDIYLGTDNPLRIEATKMKKTNTGFLSVVVLLAPRIESE